MFSILIVTKWNDLESFELMSTIGVRTDLDPLRHSGGFAVFRMVVLRSGRIADELLVGLHDADFSQSSLLRSTPDDRFSGARRAHLCQLRADHGLGIVSRTSNGLRQQTQQRLP